MMMMIKHSDFAKRLDEKMRSQGVSKMELHQLTGVSYEMIRRYLSGEAKPREDKVVLIAEALNTTASYLDYGIELISTPQGDEVGFDQSFDQNLETLTDQDARMVKKFDNLRYLPVLSISQAGHLHKTNKVAVANSFEPVLGSFYNSSSYWVVIDDDGMKPFFHRRDLVLIDPNLKPNPSDFVLAYVEDKEKMLFRKWRPRGFSEVTGESYDQLIAEHEDYPIIDSRNSKFEVCGVAVELKHRLK